MRLVLITVIIAFVQILSWTRCHVVALPQQGSSLDPCADSPCGKGAECKSMGSIAICVCPEDGKGDPFVACMNQGVDDTANNNDQISASTSSVAATVPSSSTSSSDNTGSALTSSLPSNQFVASFDIGSVHHPQSRTSASSSSSSTTTTPTPTTESSTTTRYASSSTTTPSPYVHIYTSSSRPATISHPTQNNLNYNNNDNNPNNNNYHQNQPETHRIPIIPQQDHHSHNPNGNNNYNQHEYPPKPMSPSSSSSYDLYGGSASSSSSSASANIFNNDKVYAPIADFGMSYSDRGQTGHLSGSSTGYHHYDYDRRPIAGGSSSSSSYHDRYGHHSHHPASSGFPGPITESSSSRYPASSGSSPSYYDIYNPPRNDLSYVGSGSSTSRIDDFTRIQDPLGKYQNCRMVNGIVVCADNTNRGGDLDYLQRDTTPTSHYGFHSSRDRDQYSSYYPSSSIRYPSMITSSSARPFVHDSYDDNRYPQHSHHPGGRPPLDRADESSNRATSYYPFKEQRISAQSIHTISEESALPSSTFSSGGTTMKNDNDNPMCRSMCGVNSICRLVLDRPVCGCPEGHTGDPSVRCEPTLSGDDKRGTGAGFCQRHVECKESEVCVKNKCVDPCKDQQSSIDSGVGGVFSGGSSGAMRDDGAQGFKGSICGTNAECLVVGHTPLCKCTRGYFGNPYVACVP